MVSPERRLNYERNRNRYFYRVPSEWFLTYVVGFISEGESTILPPLTFRDRVARRAYFLYLEQPERQGHDLEDWLLAEQQIRAESGPRPRSFAWRSQT
jgi:hypothetical protein